MLKEHITASPPKILLKSMVPFFLFQWWKDCHLRLLQINWTFLSKYWLF